MRNLFYLLISATILMFFCSFLNTNENENNNYVQKKIEIDYNYTSLMRPNEDGKRFISPVVKLNLEVDPETSDRRVVNIATGFSVQYDKNNNKSYIVSNNHFCKEVIDTLLPSHLFYEDSRTLMSQEIQYSSGDAKIIATDPLKDLCLLTVDGYIRPAELVPDDYEVKQMDSVILVGAPGGVFPIVRQTHISNFHERDAFPDDMALGENLLLISDIVFPGQSGSPVFNTQGKVIGIISMSLSHRNGEKIYGGIAIPYQDLKEFLKKHKVM